MSTADECPGADSGEEQTSNDSAAHRHASLGTWTEAEKKELVKTVRFLPLCARREDRCKH